MRRLSLLVTLLLISILSSLTLASCIVVAPPGASPYPQGPGAGMGPGMMGRGGMMGPSGMMGPGRGWSAYTPTGKPLTIEQATNAAQRYLRAYDGDLLLTEVMEFAWNFYAEVEEEDTGIHALELLVDKYSGEVYPEMGPNMMWNTKYGMMTQMMGYDGGLPTADMPINSEKAKELAQRWLELNLPGIKVAEADTFYGYYTLHTLKDGQIEGMLSVNGYTGAVWYHTWHGPFLKLKELED